ncbi:hypothetical protein [Nitratireductor rhodophyticola]|uniref:hypothetical protein n=1 Tax=Nitratireductor rhodophyticola TaxID=2854036 RepID=UPI003BAD7754
MKGIEIEQAESARQERVLHEHFGFFLRKWAPKGHRDREFEADLHMLVRAVHQDAAQPFSKILERAFAAMPIQPIIKGQQP